MSNKRIVQANGVGLCVEPFGDPADPTILLIHGAAARHPRPAEAYVGWLASAATPRGCGRENVNAVRRAVR